MVKFDSFQLPQEILAALADMGFDEATPIQEAVIPALLAGRDVIGQAQTGTGKTAAFGIPLVMAADQGRPGLVLCPTRELAQQVSAEIDRIGAKLGVRSIALYGGAAFGPQARAIQQGDFTIVVATPGRLRDHFERGTIDPTSAAIVVLDEADEMLKMGFAEEVEAILEAVGPDRQTLLFSATMPDRIVQLAEKHMRPEAEHMAVAGENDSLAAANTEQFAMAVDAWEKADALVRLLAVERPTGTLVFRHTRESVDGLVQALRAKGLASEALHGGMEQAMRERVLSKLREGKGMVVVATNVAARGLDVDCISHVVNFDAPREAESYVHRIGRTGRAGRDGKSFLFVTPADRGKLRGIERILGHRLDWRNVPTDAEVRDAVTTNTAAWLTAQADAPSDSHLASVDAAVAAGRDLRALAATLLSRVAPHEGLTEQRLEACPRRPRAAVVSPSQRHFDQRPAEHGIPCIPLAVEAVDVRHRPHRHPAAHERRRGARGGARPACGDHAERDDPRAPRADARRGAVAVPRAFPRWHGRSVNDSLSRRRAHRRSWNVHPRRQAPAPK